MLPALPNRKKVTKLSKGSISTLAFVVSRRASERVVPAPEVSREFGNTWRLVSCFSPVSSQDAFWPGLLAPDVRNQPKRKKKLLLLSPWRELEETAVTLNYPLNTNSFSAL